MGEIETLYILDEIQSIVVDKLQVVSYKWLSRNFLVPSNTAKRLLQEFVDKYGIGLEVIYSVSGWLKSNPSTYHIRLVSKHNLSGGAVDFYSKREDAKQEFDGNCSFHVYSIQACLPKDPASLWNYEFVQAEDLFKQPLTMDNCLRDNRYCGVSNSFVRRNAGETTSGTGTSGFSKSYSTHQCKALPQPQQKKVQQSSPNSGVQSPDIAKIIKTENRAKLDGEQGAQVPAGKEKVPQSLPNKKQGQGDKNSSSTGSALASMWGRASTKSKPDVPSAQANNSKQNAAASAEAQICAREAVEDVSNDEEAEDINIKRKSNGESTRKRRVVIDYSDEEDEYQDAVSLESPDPPKKSSLCSKESSNASVVERNLSFEEKENKPKIMEAKDVGVETNQHLGDKVSAASGNKAESPPSEKARNNAPEADTSTKNNSGPKRRKLLKTRIDERGREVTEVVWEGEEPDTKPDDNSMKAAENTVTNATNRPPVAKKSPANGYPAALSQAGKTGNKKGGNKDPKQGNILSFFKKA